MACGLCSIETEADSAFLRAEAVLLSERKQFCKFFAVPDVGDIAQLASSTLAPMSISRSLRPPSACFPKSLGDGRLFRLPGRARRGAADAAARWRQRAGGVEALSGAKSKIGYAGKFIVDQALQLHGGMGMTDELNIGHYFKRISSINMLRAARCGCLRKD